MLKIRMQKADNGDCISIETQSEFVLIDGGTAQSFSNWKASVIGKDKIDSLIVTHIDNDHVNGIIKLLLHDDCPNIEQFYFNGAEQLFGQLGNTDKGDRRSEAKLQALSVESSTVGNKEEIGCSEGSSLSYLLAKKNLNCNAIVHGKALYREICKSFYVGTIKFSVIGPAQAALQDLKSEWEDKLNERRIKPKIISKSYYEAFEKYTKNLQGTVKNIVPITSSEEACIESLSNVNFEDDNSLPNKSSLTFLIESNGKRLLYLSDCDTKMVTSWLDHLSLQTIKVDAVKISHHGSKNNTSLELLKRIDCNKYLISTNGKSHGHPDLEALARIAVVNKKSGAKIFLNYEVDHIPNWFIAELRTCYPNITLCMNSCEVDL